MSDSLSEVAIVTQADFLGLIAYFYGVSVSASVGGLSDDLTLRQNMISPFLATLGVGWT